MSPRTKPTAAADPLAVLTRGRKERAIKRADAHLDAGALPLEGPERIDPARFTGSDEERLAALENALDQADARAQAGIDMMKAWLDEQRGVVLREIRDSDLYKVKAATFEQYVADRWKMSRPRAYELITAAPVLRILSGIPDTRPAVSQALALAPAFEQDGEKGVRTAIQQTEAAAKTAGKRVTAASLSRTVQALGYGSAPAQRRSEEQDNAERGAQALASLAAVADRQRRLYDELGDGTVAEALYADPGRAEGLLREIAQYANRTAYRARRPGPDQSQGTDVSGPP